MNKKGLYKLIATGFGSGLLPKAPGTWGSIAAFIISLSLSYFLSGPAYRNLHLILIGTSFVVGLLAIRGLEDEWGHDPGKIVIDEWMGYWMAIALCPPTVEWMLGGLVLFRLLDITKVLGIAYFDRIPSALGVMLDDALAGVYTAAILLLVKYVLV